MRTVKISRRQFMVGSALYGSALWLSWSEPRPRAWAAAAASTEPTVLNAAEWKILDAITARLIPTDDLPGAREAGCVNFIDKALANEDSGMRPLYAEGLEAFETCARARERKSFTELDAQAQDAFLIGLQGGAFEEWKASVPSAQFFEAVRIHTVIGFLSDPVHGGNRDYAGWKAIGYPGPAHHRGGYTPAQMVGEQKVVPIWEDEES
jgi:gluconate 2-dehydrogenase gamma chain